MTNDIWREAKRGRDKVRMQGKEGGMDKKGEKTKGQETRIGSKGEVTLLPG